MKPAMHQDEKQNTVVYGILPNRASVEIALSMMKGAAFRKSDISVLLSESEGRTLISVHCDNKDWEKKAETLLESAGAKGISSTKEGISDVEVIEQDQPISRSA